MSKLWIEYPGQHDFVQTVILHNIQLVQGSGIEVQLHRNVI